MKTYTIELTLSEIEMMHNALTFQASELSTINNSRITNEDEKSTLEETIEELSIFASRIYFYHKFIKFMKVGDK